MAAATKRRKGIESDALRKKSKSTVSTTSRRVTRQMTTDGPRKAVFATAELLENIFMFLPLRSIIGSQRTCRQFRDIVATSVKIQEEVFLRPAERDRPLWTVKRPTSAKATGDISVRDSTMASTGIGVATQPVKMHPILQPTGLYFDSPRLWSPHDKVVQRANLNLPEKFCVGSTGSWLSMYLTNPPISKAVVRFSWEIGSGAYGIVERTVSDEQGVTFGQLIDAVINWNCSELDSGLSWKNGIANIERLPLDKAKLGDVLGDLEAQHGRRAQFSRWSYVEFVITPSAEEWKQVR